MKNLKYAKAAIFLVLILFCVACCSKKVPQTGFSLHEPGKQENVLFVTKAVTVELDMSDPKDTGPADPQTVPLSFSSGTGVSIYSNANYSDILTAGHVCTEEQETLPKEVLDLLDINFTLYDLRGNAMQADVIAIDEESDLCILRVYRSIKPVALSTRELMPGDTVYYSGYPLGIYAPNTLHTFSGRFSGSDSMGFQMYSLPAAPGSSGSPIYDEHGKLIGILSAIPEDFSHLSIGAGLDRIKMFLYLAKDCQKYCVD